MTHHRGAYLQSLSLLVHGRMDQETAYLWTVPMFHCNGWCLTWGVTAVGGLHVCLRKIDPERIWTLLRDEGVTHFSAAPTVLTMIADGRGCGRAAAGAPGRRADRRLTAVARRCWRGWTGSVWTSRTSTG